MASTRGSNQQVDTLADRIDTSVAHPARVYDCWLGGKDHYPPDAAAARAVLAVNPGIGPGVLANRAFLARAVRYLVAEAGVRQILDLGTGLPSADNVHEVAQRIDPGTRVVYCDNDPIVLAHAQALLTGVPGTVGYLDADLRDTGSILRQAAQTLDLDRPVALMLLMVLQFVPEDDDPAGIVATLMDALPSGSHLVVSHPALVESPVASAGTAVYNQKVATPMTRRTPAQLGAFFDGLQLVEPGLVPLTGWRPDPDTDLTPTSPALCGVGRKP